MFAYFSKLWYNMHMNSKYNPKDFEDKIYDEWVSSGVFSPKVDKTKKPFVITMPPPNITGQLHMGHALNNSLQDAIIRYKRMQGYNALFLPGTDHASIATELKIVEQLKKEQKTKADVGRDGFLKKAYEWKDLYGGKIVQQLKKLGVSCDWNREAFTMDEKCSQAVKKAFVDMYNEGRIYQGDRIIHWCIDCHTAISDAEVEYEPQDGFLWHIKYPLSDGSGFVTVATTRPET
ncbi:MAG: class I tRNA ligase family protein, partial [Firmicutes bacterium]|nr:class I tRNA ligase family protein [Bacillota bacterium]